jgi:hemoglobin-like flavoprotein
MTPAQKQLVQSTWNQVLPIADTAAAMFYRRLFEIDPSTETLFGKTDMAKQRKKLLQVLSMAVASLDRLDALTSAVEDLGRRHANYGVADAHYDSVGVALLWTLEQGLGKDWTPEVAAAWTDVYGLLAGIMRNSMRAAIQARKSAA